MSLALDPRLSTALRDEGSARGALNEIHQQILASGDPRALAELLAKYSAAAVARRAVATRRESARIGPRAPVRAPNSPLQSDTSQMLSNLMKAVHEASMSMIQNMKA